MSRSKNSPGSFKVWQILKQGKMLKNQGLAHKMTRRKELKRVVEEGKKQPVGATGRLMKTFQLNNTVNAKKWKLSG